MRGTNTLIDNTGKLQVASFHVIFLKHLIALGKLFTFVASHLLFPYQEKDHTLQVVINIVMIILLWLLKDWKNYENLKDVVSKQLFNIVNWQILLSD